MNAGRLRTVIAVLALALCAGCVIYPDRGIPEVGQRRGFAPEESFADLQPGQTTRADVLCALGEPDWAAEDGALLAYWTHEVHWVMFVYLVFDMGAMGWGDDHFLLFQFDERGVLAQKAQRKKSFEQNMGSSGALSPKTFEAFFTPGSGG